MTVTEEDSKREAERKVLEDAANRIAALAGNEIYQFAWRRAVKVLHDMILKRL
jgi:hypothetical protein